MSKQPLNLSFEIFPARSESAERQLTQTMDALRTLNPSCISVTYGAGGSNTDRSLATIDRLSRKYRTPLAGHLTTIGQTSAQTDAVVDAYAKKGIKHIVALRGDTPLDGVDIAEGEGYADAAALTAALKSKWPGQFKVSVAAYPECHPLSRSAGADMNTLVAKFDAGADQAITQFSFLTAPILRLRDQLARRGIDKPLSVGILPIADFAQTRRFARRCGATVPPKLIRAFENVAGDAELTRLLAISTTVEQITALVQNGITNLHFYTLNRADLILAIDQVLGISKNTELPLQRQA